MLYTLVVVFCCTWTPGTEARPVTYSMEVATYPTLRECLDERVHVEKTRPSGIEFAICKPVRAPTP